MNPFEYLLTFASVILALAVGDVVVSLNRLLQAGKQVTWDWLAPLAAVVVFLKIVTQWWSWFAAAPLAKGMTFGMYIGVLVGAVLLFLLAATTLPDKIEDHGIDLAAYYASIHRRFWLLFAAHWVVMQGVRIWIGTSVEHAHFAAISPFYAIVPVALALAFWWNRWAHLLGLLGFLALYLGPTFERTLNN